MNMLAADDDDDDSDRLAIVVTMIIEINWHMLLTSLTMVR
jgi:hypothetical protein